MPVITLHKLPQNTRRMVLEKLATDLKKIIAGVKALKLQPEDVSVLMPSDLLDSASPSEIIIEISNLFEDASRTKEVKQHLVALIGETVRAQFPRVPFIECSIETSSPREGVWMSKVGLKD